MTPRLFSLIISILFLLDPTLKVSGAPRFKFKTIVRIARCCCPDTPIAPILSKLTGLVGIFLMFSEVNSTRRPTETDSDTFRGILLTTKHFGILNS